MKDDAVNAVDTMDDVELDDAGKPKRSLFRTLELLVVDEVKFAKDYIEELQADDRIKRWNRYYGKSLGNEKSGRSKFMSRDILETIEWIMPSLMSTFVSSDSKVEIKIKGQPPVVGQALMAKIQEDLNDDDERSLYILFYQWFKDALVSDTAFVGISWDTDTKTEKIRIPQASREQMMMIDQSPDVELVEYTDEGDGTYTDVDVEVESTEGEGIDAVNLPHWDVLVSKDAKFINDEYGKGYKSKVTLDYLLRTNRQFKRDGEGEEFFTGLGRLKQILSGRSSNADDSEYTSYMDGAEDSSGVESPTQSEYSFNPDKKVDPKQTVDVVQWYTRADVDGDGVLKNIKCWIAEGEVLLRWELNDDDAVLISAISPIIDCYKFFGIAFTDLIMDIQNLKTMIIRRVLDNFDFTTLGRTFIKPGGAVPLRELLQNVPGDTLLLDPSRVKTEYPQSFDSRVLTLLEYVDGMKENRTGSTRYNQGTDAESLNKTAAGMSMIQTASQKRVDMVARLFAETGIRDLYKKCALLYQKNQTQPFTVNLDGREMQVQPQQLQGKIECRVNLGIESQVGQMEAQKVQQIFAFLIGVNQVYPGIVGPQEAHNLAVKFVANMGNKQPEDYVATMDEFTQAFTQAQQQAQQLQQAQMQLEQEKIKVEYAKVQIEAKKLGVELQDISTTSRDRIRTKKMDIGVKHEANRFRLIADMAKVQATRAAAASRAKQVGGGGGGGGR